MKNVIRLVLVACFLSMIICYAYLSDFPAKERNNLFSLYCALNILSLFLSPFTFILFEVAKVYETIGHRAPKEVPNEMCVENPINKSKKIR